MYAILAKMVDSTGEQIKYVAGEFTKITNALLFSKAYEERYKTECEIIEK